MRARKSDHKARRHVRGNLFVLREGDMRLLLGRLRLPEGKGPVLMPFEYVCEPNQLADRLLEEAEKHTGITDIEISLVAKLTGKDHEDVIHIFRGKTAHPHTPQENHEFEEFGWYHADDTPNAFYNQKVFERFLDTLKAA